MKLTSTMALITALFCCNLAQAQDAHPFVGKWRIGPSSKTKASSGSDLVLTATDGTWQGYAISAPVAKKAPCVNLKAPVRFEPKKDNVMLVTIPLSEVLNGCHDLKIKLVAEEGKAVEAFQDGEPLTIQKN